MPVSKEFIFFVSEIAAKKSTELDLSFCPGVDATSPSKFDFLSIALALRGNNYFKSLVITHAIQKNAADGLAIIMR